jgi:PAS domain S-box-containing protein
MPKELGLYIEQSTTVLTLLESAPIAVVVVDTKGTIALVNGKTEELFGYKRDELVGQPLEKLIPMRFAGHHHQHRDDYFDKPRARTMGSGMDLAAQRKDGTEFPVEVGLSYVEIGGERLAMSFITDISVRVEAVESLRSHAQELESRVMVRTQEIERRRRVAEGLRDVLAVLNTARPLEEILDLIVEQASHLLGTDAIAIYRQGEGEDAQRVQAARFVDDPATAGDAAPTGGLLPALSPAQDGAKPLRVGGDAGMTQSGRYRSVLAVPLNVQGEIYGSICLYYRVARSFTQEEKEMAVVFADQAALAIENARLREEVGRSAVAAERTRLARELHDAVTQTLFSTSLIAEVLPKIWQRDPEEGMNRAGELRELTRGALAEMRTLLLELRPTALLEAKLGDLLHQLADAVTGRARIPVSVAVEGEGTLPSDVQIAFYRIAQESLNNVAKHSGASRASVKLYQTAASLSLEIEDDGRGFDLENIPSNHLGLNIMRERAEAIGARLEIVTAKGKHSRINATWHRSG